MDRFESMALLIAAAEAGSFSAASRRLSIPLPTVSRKIADLEKRLNVRLVVRSSRRLTLTDAGAAYVAASKRILEQVSEAEAAAAGEYREPKGELNVTAPVVFGRLHVLPVICDFLVRFPQINIRLTLADHLLDLAEDQIDLAVRVGALPDSTLIAVRVGSIRRVVCASPNLLASLGTPKRLEDLERFPCVSFAQFESGESWTFAARNRRRRRLIKVACRLRVNTAESAVDAAIAGVGLTQVLSYQAAGAVAQGLLRVVLKEVEPEPLAVHLIHTGKKPLPLKLRSFMDFAVPMLRRALARTAKP